VKQGRDRAKGFSSIDEQSSRIVPKAAIGKFNRRRRPAMEVVWKPVMGGKFLGA
jgi:hypothetical protein